MCYDVTCQRLEGQTDYRSVMRSQSRPATQPQHDDTRYQHHARIHFSNEADPAEVRFVMMASFREMPPSYFIQQGHEGGRHDRDHDVVPKI